MTYTFRNQASRLKLDRLVTLLATPHTIQQAADALHLSETAIGQYLAHLGAAVHICAWVRTGVHGPLTAVYRTGEGRTAKKPVGHPYRKRRDDDPERREAYLKRRKADYLIAKEKKADPLTSAVVRST